MDYPTLCTRFDNPGRQGDQRISHSINVSLGGARFQSTFPVNSGEVLDITMALGDNLVTFKAKVVYVTPSEDRVFEFGVSFIDSERQDRIALNRFIYHFKGPIQR
ncbi:MAG: PilZ domain-containing protein [Candidatus Hodarchaeota archaeon]